MMKSLATTSVVVLLGTPLAVHAGPPAPVPVQVTNPVVPVEVRNADPVPVNVTPTTAAPAKLYSASGSGSAPTEPPHGESTSGRQLIETVTLTSVTLQVQASGTAQGFCSMKAGIAESNSPGSFVILATVGRVTALANGSHDANLTFQLPNIVVLPGQWLVTSTDNGAGTGSHCVFSHFWSGIKSQ